MQKKKNHRTDLDSKKSRKSTRAVYSAHGPYENRNLHDPCTYHTVRVLSCRRDYRKILISQTVAPHRIKPSRLIKTTRLNETLRPTVFLQFPLNSPPFTLFFSTLPNFSFSFSLLLFPAANKPFLFSSPLISSPSLLLSFLKFLQFLSTPTVCFSHDPCTTTTTRAVDRRHSKPSTVNRQHQIREQPQPKFHSHRNPSTRTVYQSHSPCSNTPNNQPTRTVYQSPGPCTKISRQDEL